jgi:hypothetical protein
MGEVEVEERDEVLERQELPGGCLVVRHFCLALKVVSRHDATRRFVHPVKLATAVAIV